MDDNLCNYIFMGIDYLQPEDDIPGTWAVYYWEDDENPMVDRFRAMYPKNFTEAVDIKNKMARWEE